MLLIWRLAKTTSSSVPEYPTLRLILGLNIGARTLDLRRYEAAFCCEHELQWLDLLCWLLCLPEMAHYLT
jgi:hypothetical protein